MATTDRWYISGSLGVGTAFDEASDRESVAWASVGSAISHGGWDTLNLLDTRAAAAGQGPNLSWWGVNGGSPGKAVRLGAISTRFDSTADGSASGFMSFFTKKPGGDVTEALRITSAGNVGIGTDAPSQRLHVNGGAVIGGVAIGADGAGVDYPYEYETIGVASSNMNLRLQSPNSIIVHTAGVPRLAIDNAGNMNVIGNSLCTLTVGQGSNGLLKVRHIDGKSDLNDENDNLYLNWGTGRQVVINNPNAASGLEVHGDITVRRFPANDATQALTRLSVVSRAPGGQECTWSLQSGAAGGGFGVHPNGFELWEYPATQPRLLIRPGGETVMVPQGQALRLGGEVFLGSSRTSVVGFDGGGRTGYHWVRTDGDENEMWFAYGQAWENRPDIPRRVEFAVPVWAPSFKQHSDERLKTDIRPLGDVLSRLAVVRGVSFKLTDHTGSEVAGRDIGVIAQEVERSFPELVSGGDDHYKAVSYSGLVGVLVEAIKALDAKNTLLEARLSGIEQSGAHPKTAEGKHSCEKR